MGGTEKKLRGLDRADKKSFKGPALTATWYRRAGGLILGAPRVAAQVESDSEAIRTEHACRACTELCRDSCHKRSLCVHLCVDDFLGFGSWVFVELPTVHRKVNEEPVMLTYSGSL